MGIFDQSILRGRRVLPDVAEPVTSFGIGVKELLSGGRIDQDKSLVAIDMNPETDVIYLREAGGLVYSFGFDKNIIWTSAPVYGNTPRIRYNPYNDVLGALGSYQIYIDASTGTEIYREGHYVAYDMAPDRSNGSFIVTTRSPSILRHHPLDQDYDFWDLPSPSNDQYGKAVTYTNDGRLFVGASQYLVEVRPDLRASKVVEFMDNVIRRMIASGGGFIAVIFDDLTLRYFDKDLNEIWRREFPEVQYYVSFYALDMDKFGDVYLFFETQFDGHKFYRMSGKNGNTILDFEEISETKHTGPYRDIRVFDDGRVLSCSGDTYRLLAQV